MVVTPSAPKDQVLNPAVGNFAKKEHLFKVDCNMKKSKRGREMIFLIGRLTLRDVIERIRHNYSGQLMTFVLIYRHVTCSTWPTNRQTRTREIEKITTQQFNEWKTSLLRNKQTG